MHAPNSAVLAIGCAIFLGSFSAAEAQNSCDALSSPSGNFSEALIGCIDELRSENDRLYRMINEINRSLQPVSDWPDAIVCITRDRSRTELIFYIVGRSDYGPTTYRHPSPDQNDYSFTTLNAPMGKSGSVPTDCDNEKHGHDARADRE